MSRWDAIQAFIRDMILDNKSLILEGQVKGDGKRYLYIIIRMWFGIPAEEYEKIKERVNRYNLSVDYIDLEDGGVVLGPIPLDEGE